jgi:acyl-CoA hydrolase
MEIYITVYSHTFNYNQSNTNSNNASEWLLTNDGYLTVVAVRTDDGNHEERHEEDEISHRNHFAKQQQQRERKMSSIRFAHNLPQVLPVNEQEQRRFDQALDRRRQRLQERNALQMLQSSFVNNRVGNGNAIVQFQSDDAARPTPMTADQFISDTEEGSRVISSY